MGSKWGRLKERLTPGDAKRRGVLTATILNTAWEALYKPENAGIRVTAPDPMQDGASIPLLDAMSTQALEHFAAALKRDKNVNGANLMQTFNRPSLDKFVDSAGTRFEFEMLNIEDLNARGASAQLRPRTMEQINRLRKSYDLFDRPDIFNLSDEDRNRAAEVINIMDRLRDYYPDGKFPVRITHCILENPGRQEDVVDFLKKRSGDHITEDDADALREYLNFPVMSLRDGVL